MPGVFTGFRTLDVRFPTSADLDGSDAMNVDPDYSAAYLILETDAGDGLEGHGNLGDALSRQTGEHLRRMVRVAPLGGDKHAGDRGGVEHISLLLAEADPTAGGNNFPAVLTAAGEHDVVVEHAQYLHALKV